MTKDPSKDLSMRASIYQMALPLSLVPLVFVCSELVDVFWVGKLGVSALAALSGSTIMYRTVGITVSSTINVGTRTIAAQQVGAGRGNNLATLGASSFALCVILFLPTWTIGLFSCHGLLGWMGYKGLVQGLSYAYFSVRLLCLLPELLWVTQGALANAAGRIWGPFGCTIISTSVNLLVTPLLVFGLVGVPRLGIAGAAWGTLIGSVTSALALMWVQRHLLQPAILLRPRAISKAQLASILRVGLPVGVRFFFEGLVWWGVMFLLSPYGEAPLAVLGLWRQVAFTTNVLLLGLAGAASILVGRALGAGNHRKAEKTASVALRDATIFSSIIGLALALLARPILRVFLSEGEAIQSGAFLFRLLGIFKFCDGAIWSMTGVLSGAGHTKAVLAVSAPLGIARLPLGYFLSRVCGFREKGIWWSLALTEFARACLLYRVVASGVWANSHRRRRSPIEGKDEVFRQRAR